MTLETLIKALSAKMGVREQQLNEKFTSAIEKVIVELDPKLDDSNTKVFSRLERAYERTKVKLLKEHGLYGENMKPLSEIPLNEITCCFATIKKELYFAFAMLQYFDFDTKDRFLKMVEDESIDILDLALYFQRLFFVVGSMGEVIFYREHSKISKELGKSNN